MSLHNTIIQAIPRLSSIICDVRFLMLLCNKIKRSLREICIPGGDIGAGTFINLLLGGKLCDVFAAMWRPLIRRLGVGSKKEETT